jgi:hypothetical protein
MTFPIDEGRKGRLPTIQGKKKSTDRKGRWMGEGLWALTTFVLVHFQGINLGKLC